MIRKHFAGFAASALALAVSAQLSPVPSPPTAPISLSRPRAAWRSEPPTRSSRSRSMAACRLMPTASMVSTPRTASAQTRPISVVRVWRFPVLPSPIGATPSSATLATIPAIGASWPSTTTAGSRFRFRLAASGRPSAWNMRPAPSGSLRSSARRSMTWRPG